VAQGEGHEFKPQYLKKKKPKTKNQNQTNKDNNNKTFIFYKNMSLNNVDRTGRNGS
jgi:hypothetical protein